MGKGQGRNQGSWEPAVASGSRRTRGPRSPLRPGRGPGGEASWPATDGVRSAATAASASAGRLLLVEAERKVVGRSWEACGDSVP